MLNSVILSVILRYLDILKLIIKTLIVTYLIVIYATQVKLEKIKNQKNHLTSSMFEGVPTGGVNRPSFCMRNA